MGDAPDAEQRCRLTVVTAARELDIEAMWGRRGCTIGDLLDAAEMLDDDSEPSPPTIGPAGEVGPVWLDGRLVDRGDPLVGAGIADGSILSSGVAIEQAHRSCHAKPRAAEGFWVEQIAGDRLGVSAAVSNGDRLTFRHREGTTIVGHVGSAPSPDSAEAVWAPYDYVELGSQVVAVTAGDACAVAADAVNATRVVHRPPRVISAKAVEAPPRPEPPTQPSKPAPLSIATMLGPLPIGIAMALLFRPYFLLFAAAGPILALARWVEGRRRFKRESVVWQAEVFDQNENYRQEVRQAQLSAAREFRRQTPTLVELLDRAERADPRLWERLPTHPDFGLVTLAYGTKEWSGEWSGDAPSRQPLGASRSPRSMIPVGLVPITVSFLDHRVIGIVGTGSARRLARALIAQLATLSGPAHLRIVDATTSVSGDACSEWSWLKWLPHYCGQSLPSSGTEDMALTVEICEAGEISEEGDGREASKAHGSTCSIVIASDKGALPTECGLIVDCRSHDDGLVPSMTTVVDVASGIETTAGNFVGLRRQTAEAVARHLAPALDPLAGSQLGEMEASVALVDVLGWHDDSGPGSQWSVPGSADELKATIGIAPQPFTIDLVSDGPHALVAGTTGSGKSELLRTWITALCGRYSTKDCTFVLVDFKGGGAFDAVADLPHVAAVVTDLDEGQAQRGLRSLRAELKDRELRLRDAGVTDIVAYRQSGRDDLPRLVLMIDEFATLAAELPSFLDGLVDIAQRGRSLGVHLVLATQRPAGVLDQKIRSNTNLRICLRVQDTADSLDVIDVRDAAELPTDRPGRALIRVGAERLTLVQCAHIGPSSAPPSDELRVRRFAPPDTFSWEPVAPPTSGAIERVKQAITAFEPRCNLEAPAPLWQPPLPARLSRRDLRSWGDEDSRRVPIGLEDLPDERRQAVWRWTWADGPLLVVGGGASERRAVIASVVDHCGRCEEPLDVYAIAADPSSSAMGPPGWGGAIASDDIEAIARILLRCRNNPTDERPIIVVVERYDLIGNGAPDEEVAMVRQLLDDALARSKPTVSFVLGGATERSVPSRVTAHVSQRLILRLADPAGYGAFGLRARTMPAVDEMTAIDAQRSTAVRLAGDLDEDGSSLQAPPSSPIEKAPDVVAGDRLSIVGGHNSELALCLGIDLVTHEPSVVTITADEPFLIAGNRRTGRSAALTACIDAVTRGDNPRRCIVGAHSLANVERWIRAIDLIDVVDVEGDDVDEILGGAAPGSLVVVDDGERIDDDRGRRLVASVRRHGHLLVVATSSDSARALRSWTSALRASRNGLVLGFDRADADILHAPVVGFPGIRWTPGRGVVSSQGDPRMMQVAWSSLLDASGS